MIRNVGKKLTIQDPHLYTNTRPRIKVSHFPQNDCVRVADFEHKNDGFWVNIVLLCNTDERSSTKYLFQVVFSIYHPFVTMASGKNTRNMTYTVTVI